MMGILVFKSTLWEYLLWCVYFCSLVTFATSTDSMQLTAVNNAGLSGCGFTKGCYREPEKCTSEQDCTSLLTWLSKGDQIEFELSAKADKRHQWTALGFSLDDKMGDDSVTDCIHDTTNDSMIIQSSWNNDTPNNVPLEMADLGIVPGTAKGSFKDGVIMCSFTRYVTVVNSSSTDSKNLIYNITQPFYLFLARGPTNGVTKLPHTEEPAISPKMITLNSDKYSNIGGEQRYILVIAHGSLMIIAWMLLASVSILMPKYFKDSWLEQKVFGKLLWFQMHRIMMILVLIFTCIGTILIFVQVGGYAKHLTGAHSAHPIVGIIVLVLVFLNPVIALIRPGEDAPNRPIFNAVHMTIGTAAHIGSFVAIVIGVRLGKAGMSDWTLYMVIAFIVWYVMVKMLLHVHHKSYMGGSSRCDGYVNFNESEGTPMTELASDNERVKSGKIFKTVILLLHIVVLLGCSFALIADLARRK